LEFLTEKDFCKLSNPGVTSEQLLSPHNSGSQQVTITRVTVKPGVEQPRHSHEYSEQIWIAFSGRGMLLLDQEKTREFSPGDVVRFDKGDVHGLSVVGNDEFVYLSVTSPPLDFSSLYQDKS